MNDDMSIDSLCVPGETRKLSESSPDEAAEMRLWAEAVKEHCADDEAACHARIVRDHCWTIVVGCNDIDPGEWARMVGSSVHELLLTLTAIERTRGLQAGLLVQLAKEEIARRKTLGMEAEQIGGEE